MFICLRVTPPIHKYSSILTQYAEQRITLPIVCSKKHRDSSFAIVIAGSLSVN